MLLRIRRRAAVVLMVLGLALGIPLGVLASHQFADVPDSNQFHNDIDALVDTGVTFGCGGGNFCPSDYVTREQMAAFMNRLGSLDGATAPSVNADKVDGVDAFAGQGTALLLNVVDPSENRTPLGTIPGLGSFSVGGAILGPGEDCDVSFTNTSGADLVINGAALTPLANGASIELAGTGSRPDGRSVTFSIATAHATTVASGQVVLLFGHDVVCVGSVQAVVSG